MVKDFPGNCRSLGVALALLVLVSCSSSGPSDDSSIPGKTVPTVADASGPPGENPEAAGAPSDVASGAGGPQSTNTGRDPASRATEVRPESGGPTVEAGGTPDEWDTKMRADQGTRLIAGSTSRAEWRLYGWNEGADTCLEFHIMGTTTPTGGSGTMCEQRPPLDTSGSNGPEGRFFFGLVDARAARVRVEHRDGATHTYTTVAAEGFRVRFYAGEASPTPVARVVALDEGGRVLAERKEPEALNTNA